jgi:hypothetical protein
MKKRNNKKEASMKYGILSLIGMKFFLKWTSQKGESMKHVNMGVMAGSFLVAAVIAGCASGPTFNQSSEASTSAIRAAEEVGAPNVPRASLYLQFAKEELEGAKKLSEKGEKEQAVSLLLRAEADAELSVALSHEQTEKTEAAQAIEKVRQLRQDNPVTIERSNP